MKKILAVSLLAISAATNAADQQSAKTNIPDSPIPIDSKTLPPPDPNENPAVTEFRSNQLSEEDIKKIRQIILDARRAKLMPIPNRFQAKPVNRVLTLDLSPGATPPVIRIGDRQGCSLTFSDASGKEWPMYNFTNFTPAIVTVNRPVESASLITIEPADTSGTGNVTVFLKGIKGEVIPVSFTVLTEQQEVDYVVSVIVPKLLSPDGISSPPVTQQNESLELALAGITPQGAIKLRSDDNQVEGWKVRGEGKKTNIILRSKAALLTPAPLHGRKLTSRDGTRAYEIPYTPVITILSEGKSKIVKLSEPE